MKQVVEDFLQWGNAHAILSSSNCYIPFYSFLIIVCFQYRLAVRCLATYNVDILPHWLLRYLVPVAGFVEPFLPT